MTRGILVYLGLAVALAGAVRVLRPRLLRRRPRGIAMFLLPAGLLLAGAGAWWPAEAQRGTAGTLLDEVLPEYHSRPVSPRAPQRSGAASGSTGASSIPAAG